MGAAEGGGFFFREGAEFAGAALDGGGGDVVRKLVSFGARALGEREHVEVGEGETFDEGQGCGVVVFGFAGETGDDVGADGGVGKAFMDELDAAGVVLGAIPAVHSGENAVGGGLQGHVEVLGYAVGGSEKIDQVLGDVEGLDGADAEALDSGFIENAIKERFEFDARGKIAAVGAEVNAAENDFAEAGFGEAANFLDDGVGRETAAFSADEGDDAVGAAGVAAVLDFEGGARVVAFAAEDRGTEQNILVENVAG